MTSVRRSCASARMRTCGASSFYPPVLLYVVQSCTMFLVAPCYHTSSSSVAQVATILQTSCPRSKNRIDLRACACFRWLATYLCRRGVMMVQRVYLQRMLWNMHGALAWGPRAAQELGNKINPVLCALFAFICNDCIISHPALRADLGCNNSRQFPR